MRALRNGLKEYKRHGEAGSVDVNGVESERQRISKILAEYPLENHLNADEWAVSFVSYL